MTFLKWAVNANSMSWRVTSVCFVALQLCVAAMVAVAAGFYHFPPLIKYLQTALMPVALYAAGFALWNIRDRPERPIRHILTLDWQPFLRFAGAMSIVWLQFVALTWMKAMIPATGSMWADPLLANLEAGVLGQDAWRLLPQPPRIVEILYLLWPLALCGSFTALYFMRSERRDAVLLSFFLTLGLLGTFGQYLLPSGGPVFWERLGFGDRFASMAIPSRTTVLTVYLWEAYQGREISFATGISAFPSIHVATTTWIAISFRHWVAYIYLAVIFFGSIALGWHYALDGVAGILGALLCYRMAKAMTGFEMPVSRIAT